MKKVITLALAVLLCLAISVPAFAANTTGSSTTLTYEVVPCYTVIIPDALTITDGSGTGTITVTASSLIEADKELSVKITAAANYDAENSKFRLKNSLGTSIYLDYAITDAENHTVTINSAFMTATPDEVNAGKSAVLTLTSGTAKSAGFYSDTLTFTVSVATPD